MNTPEHLYHYTSLETLALILENQSICFNSLLYVDDMEESEAADIKNFGKYVYVSCWTNEEQEMISMWSLYTPGMRGVRIRLPAFPFVKYHYNKGEYGMMNEDDLYIDLRSMYSDNKAIIFPGDPTLKDVQYTKETEKLFPSVRLSGTELDNERTFCISDSSTAGYSLQGLGEYKRDVWSFQKEWRYILHMSPMGYPEFLKRFLETGDDKEIFRRLDNPNTPPPYDRYFLKLDPKAINEMEVLFGPCMSDADKILAKSLLRSHGLDGHWKESSLQIRKK